MGIGPRQKLAVLAATPLTLLKRVRTRRLQLCLRRSQRSLYLQEPFSWSERRR
jgi:hypothetical protein